MVAISETRERNALLPLKVRWRVASDLRLGLRPMSPKPLFRMQESRRYNLSLRISLAIANVRCQYGRYIIVGRHRTIYLGSAYQL